MKRNILVIVLLASLMFLLGFTVQSKPQWEYMSTTKEKQLNELGAQGWELVAASPLITSGGTFGQFFFLKRMK